MEFEFSLIAAARKAIVSAGVPVAGAVLGAVPVNLVQRFEQAMSAAPVASAIGDLNNQSSNRAYWGGSPLPFVAQADGISRTTDSSLLTVGVSPGTASGARLPTGTNPNPSASASVSPLSAGEIAAREAEFDNGGRVGVLAPELNASPNGSANLKTLGDRILNTLQGTESRWSKVMHPADPSGVSADLQLGPLDVLQLQKELVTVSVQVELMTKGVGMATKNVDQLVRIS